MKIEIIGLRLPEIAPGTDLASEIVKASEEVGGIRDGDVIVITSKAYLKASGNMIPLSEVKPSLASKLIAKISGKNPIEVELILSSSSEVLLWLDMKRVLSNFLPEISRDEEGAKEALESVPSMLMVLTPQGLICSDAGVDYSNLPPGYAISNNFDFDKAAREIREKIEKITRKKVAVVLSDTEISATGKVGSVDIAVGCSGIHPISRSFGERDRYGRRKFGGLDILVDELSSAAALLMGQTSEGIPVVIVRGLKYERSEAGVSSISLKRIRRSPFSAGKTWLIRTIYRILYRKKTYLGVRHISEKGT